MHREQPDEVKTNKQTQLALWGLATSRENYSLRSVFRVFSSARIPARVTEKTHRVFSQKQEVSRHERWEGTLIRANVGNREWKANGFVKQTPMQKAFLVKNPKSTVPTSHLTLTDPSAAHESVKALSWAPYKPQS